MPVQTRAAAQPQPAKAVQKSAAPELKQLHFPTRRRQVTKTYGRRAAPKRPDQTLTQMEFVSAAAQEDLQLLISSDDDDEKENEETAGAANVPKQPAVKKKATRKTSARSNRRRTTGNVAQDDEKHEKPRSNKRRKTMGDPPSASSSFHTQTLTQFLSSTSKDEDVWKIPDSEDEDAVNLDLVKETPRKRKSEEVSDEVEVISAAKPVATTPANRQKKAEIPSSQSPATPLLLRDSPQKAPSPLKHPDTPDCLRYNPETEPSPLKQKSDKTSPSVSIQKPVTKTPRTLVIQDSYSTSHSSPITPTPKAKAKGILLPSGTVTPAKRIRFELPEDKENVTPGRTKPKSPKPVEVRTSQRQPLSEVPDSDDELEEETETDEDGVIDATSTVVSESTFEIREDVNEVVITADGIEDDFAAGAETQALLISSDHPVDHETLNSTPIVAEDEGSVDQEEDSENSRPRNTTPSAQDFVDDIIEQTPSRTPRARLGETERTEHEEEFTQGYTQGYTQGMESQRVPLETIKATGPITDRSDIIISIYCEHVENMTKRRKTHEFRDWKIPETVHRVWIYVPRPISELRYMCTLGPAKTAGQIHEDGLGNAEFNQGMMKRSKFAFEVLSMYELNNPVSNQVMQQNGWPRAPQKFSYVPPAVVGQLTSNLRCALWGEDAEQDVIQSSLNVTESQELAHQIRSDIDHATQLESSDQAEVIPSSQSPPQVAHNRGNRRGSSVFARPALPKTATASSARSLPASQSQRNRRETRPSQATTISQMSSSPHVSPGKSVPLPPMAGAQRTAPAQTHATSSPVAHEHSLRSSQFPTKSQMLPDSLVNGDIQEPPQIIWDSEDESD
ncbi:hypothetical protein PFICI_10406 [Pestalotiopsis fici W106-1]|uniref:Uncharacterized protein n=1 Tax=Pestalotiopsis fici (strain W106-1 / CGMCC3.15140) TaxID=1229662 RepID=W3WX25_PESFW|nr:uncharacterized protein PFICI_10406 [Pestalotiopsis fici W106-1]ETS78344.1 hypothetical protein PFICI_10406 [Pestalotiopsis fici W106-1]